ncbi:hypothetical protein NP493_158g03012 [Ridgeia piscesae]|uniref:VWFD domain-containing protein n=1 Tax=Ridgeia piscesae TaxID=27915 RepID=A0AAD9UFS7_RIDPI|nr:hypothetical protein NP493_158g03012 [Ridgeia piscesae]
MVSGLLVNVWIVPSPNDIGHTKGLCGTYDWEKSNEFNLRNGSVLEQTEKDKGKRPQPHEFILDWQVDLYGKDSIFRGVETSSEEFTLHRYCTCVEGQPGVCGASHDISTCDIYQGKDVTDQFIKNAVNLTTTVKSRKRRSVNENTVIKTDEPILLNKGYTPKDTHPWKHGWNKTYAYTFCTDNIRDNYTLGKLCSQIPGVNFDQEITTCVEDIHIIGDASWLDSARSAMKEQCLEEIQKNGNLPDNITQQIEGMMCVNDCSRHGQCVDGKCRCEIGFGSADCSVKYHEPPFKVGLPLYGLCDRQFMKCDTVIVYGTNFVNSDTLKCHLRKCQVMENSWKPLGDAPILEKAQFINFNAVECRIPAHNQSYIIKVTNDGVALSAGLLFIPFDSRCNNCSTNYKRCSKKRDSCIINGECYANKDLKDNSNDSCEVCDPFNNQYDWTTLQVPRCRPPWWQNVPDWVVALVAAVGGSLVGLLVGFLLYKCCCKSRRKSDPAQEVALDNQTDIIASSPFEDHMLHRNRGLPAYSGGGDQFADLTLRQPDFEETYFYNDGRGVENGIDSNTYFY